MIRGDSHRRLVTPLICLAAGLLAGCGERSSPTPADPDAFWQAIETFQAGRAEQLLGAWRESQGPSREWSLASAIQLMQRQPRTAANVKVALGRLQDLAKGDDENAAVAHYYIARIYDYHGFPPRRDLATREYERLLERFPGRLPAELAFASLAANRLFAKSPDQSWAVVFSDLEAGLGRLQHAAAKRAGHYVLADAALRLVDDRDRALQHLEQLWHLQPRVFSLRADTLVKLAEINLSLGRYDPAAHWYRLFLSEFSDEARASWVRDRLREAEQGAGGEVE